MPELRYLSWRVSGVAAGTFLSLDGLSGGYTHRPDPEELSPREIVERLHAEIAAKSPEHAALVAKFREKQQRGES